MNTDLSIQSRKTQKVLANPENAWPVGEAQKKFESVVKELLGLAAYAPYHFPSHESHHQELSSTVPWRFYVLNAQSCRDLIRVFEEEHIKGGKITQMLAATDALLMVTWLPEPSREASELLFEPNQRNMEHIAATSAAIQNVLLGASSRGIPNYWSSGGKLREPRFFERLGIPLQEILLGAIFLFPEDTKDAKVLSGAHREKGKEVLTWSKWVS